MKKNLKKLSKAERKAAEQKREELRKETKRRRHDNPGDGSAYLSALTFMGFEFVPMNVVSGAMKLVDNLSSYISAVQDNLDELNSTTSALFNYAWETKQALIERMTGLKAPSKSSVVRALKKEHEEATAMVANHVQLLKTRTEMLKDGVAELNSVKRFLQTVALRGDGQQKAYIKLWQDKRHKAEKKAVENDGTMRVAEKVKEKEHVKSFSVRTYEPDIAAERIFKSIEEIMKDYFPLPYHASGKQKKEYYQMLQKKRAQMAGLVKIMSVDANKPFVVNSESGVVTRLPETKLTKELGIEADTPDVKNDLVVVHHGFERMFEIPWQIFARTEADAKKVKEKMVRHLYRRLMKNGFVVEYPEAEPEHYYFVFSSSSHQKDEKAVMCIKELCEAHSDYLYFGNSLEELANKPLLGANYLKAMANRTRPEAAVLTLEDGTPLTVFDILPVKDVKRVYHHGKALSIGGDYKDEDGDEHCYKFGPVDNPVICGDGQMIALKKLNLYGQLNGEGWKGLCHGAESVIAEFCRRCNLTIEEFYDLEVETFDGRKVRLGDFAIICGEGCWKFDKLFSNFQTYLDWIRVMMPGHPDIEKLGILRQLDDEEGEHKVRRLTRSLIQQWGWADNREIRRLINREVKKLTGLKTMEGALVYLAGLNKPESERTDLERLFELCPWLILNKNVQAYLKDKWTRMKHDAMANRLVSKGQYPYIIQDPVALLELWLMKKDPQSEDLGVLKAGEISLNEVKADMEVLGVRFPANFLTAKTLVNKPHANIFESCGNCAVLSIYDDILIIQDGDVDGDEMCILYDALAIKLTKRMIEEFDPPVVVFEHSSKATPVAPGSVEAFWTAIGDALYSAHHNGQVGVYANLARDCCYLMSIALMHGDDTMVQKYMLWMAAASTGAILAIDQVKGNTVSQKLIDWLEDIGNIVKANMNYAQPWTQQFLKRDVKPDDCLDPDEDVITDRIGIAVDKAVGNFEFNGQGFEWNNDKAVSMLAERKIKHFVVHTNVLTDKVVQTIRANYFNSAKVKQNDNTEVAVDEKFLQLVKSGKEVGLKDSLLFWWHNEQALKYRLEGVMLEEAKVDLYKHIRDCLKEFVLTDKKPNKDGHVRTKGEQLTSLYTNIVWQALELGTTKNGLPEDKKGSFCIFCLRIAAPWIISIVKRNMESGEPLPDFINPEFEGTDWSQPVQCACGYTSEEPPMDYDNGYIPDDYDEPVYA